MTLIASRYRPEGGALSGGMSETFEFFDVRLKRRVILKRLQEGQESRRLMDEQKALLRVRSKHVVQLLDLVEGTFSNGKSACLVLEFIDGTDLREQEFQPDDEYLRT